MIARMTWGLLSVLLLLMASQDSRAQSRQVALEDAGSLKNGIAAACLAQGSDPNRNFYHFVFAFDTTHFGDDAGQAEAMRAEAARFAQSYLVPGDTYSIASWQMNVWDWQGEYPVERGEPEERNREIEGHFPQTHQADVTAGHDTEQAIVDVSDHLAKSDAMLAPKTILVLFTSLENSQDAPDRRSIGANDVRYQAEIKEWARQPKLPILFREEKTPGRGDWETRQFDAIIVVARQMRGVPIGRDTRTSLMRSGIVPKPRPWGGYLLGAVLGAAAVWFLVRQWIGGTSGSGKQGGAGSAASGTPGRGQKGGKPSQLTVGNRRFALNDYHEGTTWRLVGSQFPDLTAQDVVIGRTEDMVPPVQIGQLQLTGDKIQLRVFGEQTLLTSSGGEQAQTFTMARGENMFDLEGEDAPNPALPSRPYRTQFIVIVQ